MNNDSKIEGCGMYKFPGFVNEYLFSDKLVAKAKDIGMLRGIERVGDAVMPKSKGGAIVQPVEWSVKPGDIVKDMAALINAY